MKAILRFFTVALILFPVCGVVRGQTLAEVLTAVQKRQQLQVDCYTVTGTLNQLLPYPQPAPPPPSLISWDAGLGPIFPENSKVDNLTIEDQVGLLRQAWNSYLGPDAIIKAFGGPISIQNYTRALRLLAAHLKYSNPTIPWPLAANDINETTTSPINPPQPLDGPPITIGDPPGSEDDGGPYGIVETSESSWPLAYGFYDGVVNYDIDYLCNRYTIPSPTYSGTFEILGNSRWDVVMITGLPSAISGTVGTSGTSDGWYSPGWQQYLPMQMTAAPITATSGTIKVLFDAGALTPTSNMAFQGYWSASGFISDVSAYSTQTNPELLLDEAGSSLVDYNFVYTPSFGQEFATQASPPPESLPELKIVPKFDRNRLEVSVANLPENDCELYWALTSDTTQSLAWRHILNVEGHGNYDAVYSSKAIDREPEVVWSGSNSISYARWSCFGMNQGSGLGMAVDPYGSFLSEWWQPVLKQVKTATCGINIVENPDTHGDPAASAYTINFYRADQIGQKTTSGTYSFSGSPIESWTVSNPSGDDSQGGIVQIRTPKATYTLTGTTSGNTQTWIFSGGPLSETWSSAPSGGSLSGTNTITSTSTDSVVLDGQPLPTVTTNWYEMPTYPAQILDGTRTTTYTYQTGTDGEITNLSGITQTGGANPFTATYDSNELLTSYVCGSSSTSYSYGVAVTQTDTFVPTNQTVRTLTTNFSNGLTQAVTSAGVSDVTGTTVLYSGSDGTNPWAPELVAGMDGMVTTYSYSWDSSGSNFVTTACTGPQSSLVSGDLMAGTQTVTTVNPDGKVISQVVTDIGSDTDLSSVTATAYGVDTSGSAVPFPSQFTCEPLGTTIGFGYDGEGTITSATDQYGITSTYSYDALHRPIAISRGALSETITYDPGFLGQTGSISGGGASKSWTEQTDPFGMNQSLTVSGSESYTITRNETAGTLTTTSSNSTTQQGVTDAVDKTSLAESVTGNATEPWSSSFSVSSGGGWTITTTDGNDSTITTQTAYDPLGRMTAQTTPDPGGYGTSVSTTMAYTNGFMSSVTDPLDTTNYTYQPDGSIQTVSRGARSITVNRNDGALSWICTNALGETLWTRTYDATTGATTFKPYGQDAQEIITTPSITGNLLNLTRTDTFSTANNSWQDGVPYSNSYSGFGMTFNGSTSINPFDEITQSTVNPGGISGNAITTGYTLPGVPGSVSGLISASIGNSFDPGTGWTQTYTQNSHTNTQTISPEGLWMGGGTAYGQPFQTWSSPGFSGNITRTLTTGAGGVQFSFSATGNLLQRNFPDGTSDSFAYHPDGAPVSWTGPNGTLNYAPNEYGEATESGTYGSIGHDNAGRVNSISDASGNCALSYTNGQIATVSYSSGVLSGDSITHTYYSNGLLESVSLPGGKSISYTYNSDGSLDTITTAAGVTGTYGNYCAVNGRAQSITLGPLSVTGSFDGLGRSTYQSSAADGMTWAYSNTYDADGHCNYANTPQGSWTYGYDGYGFLHSAVGAGRTLNYSFDSAGRPTAGNTDYRATVQVNNGNVNVVGSVTPGAGVTINGTAAIVNGTTGQFAQTYTPTPNTWQTYVITGSLAASGTTSTTQQIRTVYVPPLSESLGYNGAGDLGNDARWSYGWNGLDQLVTISETNPYTAATATRINLVYDLQGRRVQKTVSIGGKISKVTTTLWDNWRPVMETDYSGTSSTVTAQRWYTWGPDVSGGIDGAAGIGGLVEILEKQGNLTTISLPTYDGIGNVVGYVDGTTGVPVASYSYGPFGELLAEYGPRASLLSIGYQTKERDAETGDINFGERPYRPDMLTWFSRDPTRESGGVNLYAYCDDQPVGNFDPIGESPFDLEAAQLRLARAIDNGDSIEIAAAEEGMTASPPPASGPLMQFIGGLVGPSDRDFALSPTQPLGSGLGHQTSLYGWSLLNSTEGFLSMANDPSRIITGQQSPTAQMVNDEYLKRFTYGERSGADFNTFVASLFMPTALEKAGDVVEGTVGVLRNLSLGETEAIIPGMSPAYAGGPGAEWAGENLTSNPYIGRGFKSFDALKRYLGSAGEGNVWHHIVEQSQEARFGALAIHNIDNVISIPEKLNADLNSFYSSIRPDVTGNPTLTVRQWISQKALAEQYQFGRRALINVREQIW